MKKTVCGKTYDTDLSTVVKKNTFGSFGDPEGYEETLYVTEDGKFFIYTAGGSSSKYPKADIKRVSKTNADKWLSDN